MIILGVKDLMQEYLQTCDSGIYSVEVNLPLEVCVLLLFSYNFLFKSRVFGSVLRTILQPRHMLFSVFPMARNSMIYASQSPLNILHDHLYFQVCAVTDKLHTSKSYFFFFFRSFLKQE